MVRTRQGDIEIDLAADSVVREAIDELSRNEPDRRLDAANRIRHAVDTLLTELVAEARSTGATWAEIGEILGVSTQAAHQKYRWVTLDLTEDDQPDGGGVEAGASTSDVPA